MERVSNSMCFGGSQGVYTHHSSATGTPMTFQVFIPEHRTTEALPVLWYLSGLTCTHANAMEKGHYQRACAEHGVALIGPDTSPARRYRSRRRSLRLRQGRGLLCRCDAGAVEGELPDEELRRARIARARRRRVSDARPVAAGHHRPFDGRARRADGQLAQSRAASARPAPSRRSSARCMCRGARRRSAAISARTGRPGANTMPAR